MKYFLFLFSLLLPTQHLTLAFLLSGELVLSWGVGVPRATSARGNQNTASNAWPHSPARIAPSPGVLM